jgi:hypothetical protein
LANAASSSPSPLPSGGNQFTLSPYDPPANFSVLEQNSSYVSQAIPAGNYLLSFFVQNPNPGTTEADYRVFSYSDGNITNSGPNFHNAVLVTGQAYEQITFNFTTNNAGSFEVDFVNDMSTFNGTGNSAPSTDLVTFADVTLVAAPGPIPGAGLLSYLAIGALGIISVGWKRLNKGGAKLAIA